MNIRYIGTNHPICAALFDAPRHELPLKHRLVVFPRDMSHLTPQPPRHSLLRRSKTLSAACHGAQSAPAKEVRMKFVRLVKRMRTEKSLKAYAWYGWI
ncbi:tryptorubin family RiPP precursor [Streptomyces noursei]|uniref:tryptorubin family RiPP precursor n=2 Tax=Streptomyces TaxID=1883 RepID=UPI0030F0FE18